MSFIRGDREPIEALLGVLDGEYTLCVLSLPDIEASLQKLAGSADGLAGDESSAPTEDAVAGLRDLASGAPVVLAVDEMLRRALDLHATDIHIEPMRGRLVLRFRIDGVLRAMPAPSADIGEAIVSRLKVLAGMDIAERRKPQDGGMRLKVGEREIELRVATLASLHGETLVMRILQREGALIDLAKIGLGDRDRARLEKLLEHTYGMVAVAGPTGSGKTTTLAAALSRLNDPGRKIVTIEDPVEYQIPGIGPVTDPAGDRRHLFRRDPLLRAPGPRHHSGGRDPRRRDRRAPRSRRHSRPSGAHHGPRQHVGGRLHPPARSRRRELSAGWRGARCGLAAPGAAASATIAKRPAIVTDEMLAADDRYAAVGFRAGESIHEAVGLCPLRQHGIIAGRFAVFEILVLGRAPCGAGRRGAPTTRVLRQPALWGGRHDHHVGRCRREGPAGAYLAGRSGSYHGLPLGQLPKSDWH